MSLLYRPKSAPDSCSSARPHSATGLCVDHMKHVGDVLNVLIRKYGDLQVGT